MQRYGDAREQYNINIYSAYNTKLSSSTKLTEATNTTHSDFSEFGELLCVINKIKRIYYIPALRSALLLIKNFFKLKQRTPPQTAPASSTN